MMEQLILHLVGDYVTQNHWMANRKTSSTLAALVHVALYSSPFLLLGPSWPAFAVIAGTHFLIDRFRLAKYWVAFWGVGCEGFISEYNRLMHNTKIQVDEVTRIREEMRASRPLAVGMALAEMGHIEEVDLSKIQGLRSAPEPAPPWLSVWLLILVDNTFHLAINYSALRWL